MSCVLGMLAWVPRSMYPNDGHGHVGLIPMVTSASELAAVCIASDITLWNAGMSWMSWSAGSMTMVACGFLAAMIPAPRATAGAVSRFAGSAKMFSGGRSEATSLTACSWSLLVSMRMFSFGMSPARRSMVWLSSVLSLKRLSSCLGLAFLESGQKRVPLPPARMSAYVFVMV